MNEHRLDALRRDLGDLGDLIARTRPLDREHDVAMALLALALEHVGCDQAGISTCDRRGHLTTVACTDSLVERSDHLQTTVEEGPTFQSLEDDQDLVVADLGVERRWSPWRSPAVRLGIHGVMTVRLTPPSSPVAVLTLLFTGARSITRSDLEVAQALARHAATSLAAAREVAQLHRAVETRTLIGQAEGVLMERFGIDAEHAFALLRRLSQDTNRKLRAVAAEIAETRQLPDSGPRPAARHAASSTEHSSTRSAPHTSPDAPAGDVMTPR